MNRIEYNNTINDLLGTEIKLLDRLPQDGSAFGFDTVDVGLDMAGPTLERYIEAADVALDAALAHGPRPATLKNRFEINESTKDLVTNGKRLNGAFFSLQCLVQSDRVVYFSMGAATPPETWRVLHSGRVPTAGRYTYRVKASSYQDQDRPVSYLVYAGEVRRSATDARYVGAFDVTEEPRWPNLPSIRMPAIRPHHPLRRAGAMEKWQSQVAARGVQGGRVGSPLD